MRWKSWHLLAIVVWVVLSTALQVAREPQLKVLDSLWAEDGTIFVTGALYQPVLPALVSPYNGYIHAVPRLLAEVATLLPLRFAPYVMSLGPALLISGLSLFVFLVSRNVLRSFVARTTLSLLMVLPLAMGHEILNNAANLHWYLSFACFWALLERQTSLGEIAISTVIAVGGALSSPVTVLFAPLALVHIAREGEIRGKVVPFVFLLGLALQLAAVFQATSEARIAESHLLDLPLLFGVSAAGSFLVGERLLPEFTSLFGWLFPVISFVSVVGIWILGVYGGERRAPTLVTTTLAYSVVSYCLPVFIRGTRLLTTGQIDFIDDIRASRYSVLPVFFLLTMALLAFFGLSSDRRNYRAARTSIIALLAALALINWPIKNEARAFGPRWSQELQLASGRCQAEVREFVRIPISPSGWTVLVPCRRL